MEEGKYETLQVFVGGRRRVRLTRNRNRSVDVVGKLRSNDFDVPGIRAGVGHEFKIMLSRRVQSRRGV